jgi:ABC-2 type transport system permease protein
VTPFRLTVRILRRGSVVIVAAAAFFIYVLAVSYRRLYRTTASRELLVRQFGHNRAFDAIFGQAVRIDTPGGFLMWKYSAILTVLVALWSLRSVTRVLRGDEEAGRTDLVVAGPIDITTQLRSQLGAVGGVLAVLALAMALAGVAGGLPLGGSFLMGVTMVSCGWVFGAVAAVTSQLVPTRRQATASGGTLLGAAFLVRVLATGSGRDWLCWCTPFGWAERLSPFSHPRLVALLPMAAAPVVLVAVALGLRARRDTGEGMLLSHPAAGRAPARPLASVLGLDWRLSRGTALGWGAGSVITGFVLGFLAIGVAGYARSDAGVEKLFTRYTGTSASSVAGLLGLAFAVVAVVLSVFAGTVFARCREEEGRGHADALLAGGVSRARFIASRGVLCVALAVPLAVITACAAWAGTDLGGGSPAGFWPTVRGGLNTVPVVLLFGAVALLAFGVVPRATGTVRFASVGVAYGIVFLGGALKLPGPVRDLSPFTHLAPVPAAPVDATASIVMLALAAAIGLVGAAAFARRDVLVE